MFKYLDTDLGYLPMDNETSCFRAIFTLQIMCIPGFGGLQYIYNAEHTLVYWGQLLTAE